MVINVIILGTGSELRILLFGVETFSLFPMCASSLFPPLSDLAFFLSFLCIIPKIKSFRLVTISYIVGHMPSIYKQVPESVPDTHDFLLSSGGLLGI